MTDFEQRLDECNIWLYKILNKIADIKLDLKAQNLVELNDEILRSELKEQQDD
jgi:hypothetical protein